MLESLGVLDIGVFFAGLVVVILMPGPNSLCVLSTATRRGVAAGYKAAGGVFVGDAVIMLLAALGVDSLMRLYPATFMAVQYLGAAYLAWLGSRALYGAFGRDESGGGNAPAERGESPFKRGLLLSLSNPKAIMFFVSFFVQFVDPSKGHTGAAFLVLACIVQAVSMSYLSLLIFCGAKVAAALQGNRLAERFGNVLMGVVFLGFGARLALQASG